MDKNKIVKINPQSGAIGFIVALIAAIVLAAVIPIGYNIYRVTQETAQNTAQNQYEFVAFEQAENLLGNAIPGVGYEDVLNSFSGINDQGVVFPLPAGQTLELNPSLHEFCKDSSCLIKIWWHNDVDTIDNCGAQASLLISEYSQDGTVCENGFESECDENLSRNGEPNERSRYYLFRPYSCGQGGEANSPEWAGYETAFGQGDEQRVIMSIDDNSLNLTADCETNPASCYTGVVGAVTKSRHEFRHNQQLSRSFANYYEIPVWPNTTIVRIKALYNDTHILVDLPGQVIEGSSTVQGTDGVTSTVSVKKTIEQIPSIFDFALFAGEGEITKN